VLRLGALPGLNLVFGLPRQNSHKVHLEGLVPKIKALTGHYLVNAGGMAFTHHELSVENAVIPFSLSRPTHFSQACPVTFEMEHSYR
jgi:hypothetical protein